MKTKIYLFIKKYLPKLLKLLYKEAKKHDFKIEEIKKNILKDSKLFAKQQFKLIISKYKDANSSIEGCFSTFLDDSIQENEMLLGGSEDLSTLPTIKTNIYEYNQLRFKDDYGRNLCFGYGNLGMVSDNTNKKVNQVQEKELAKLFTKTKGFIKTKGGHFSEGFRVCCDFWEKEFKIKLNRYIISTKTNDIIIILDKGMSVAIGLKASSEILESMRDDGILQEEDVVGDFKYGHLVRIKKIGNLYSVYIIDNYFGIMEYNKYKLEQLQEFLKSEYVFENCRFALPQEINKEIPASQYAKDLGLWNGERPTEPITRYEVASMVGRCVRLLEEKK